MNITYKEEKNIMKKIKLLMIVMISVALVACGEAKESPKKNESDYSVTMVADVGGVNDQSYNQGAWEGLQKLAEDEGVKTSFIETVQMSDLDTNFDKAVDGNHNLIWGIGFNTANPILKSSGMNPNIKYAIVDHDFGSEAPANLTSAMFQAEQASFMVGYIAGLTTETNKVAYIGGAKSPTMDLFEYGFSSGAKYAAAELNKDIEVTVQIIESFNDAAKGKATAASLYNAGNDVIFVAAGAAGTGAIEQAVEENKWVIGVDRDQSYLASKNVLTSALKHVGVVTDDLSKRIINGEDLAGKTIQYGIENNGVGIPEENPNMSEETYNKAIEIQELIKSNEIIVPRTLEQYESFIKLNQI